MIYCNIFGYADGKPTFPDCSRQGVEPIIVAIRQWYQPSVNSPDGDYSTGIYDADHWAAYCRSLAPGTKICLDVEEINRNGTERIIQQSTMPTSPNGYGPNHSTTNIDQDCAYVKTLIDVLRANAHPSVEVGMYDPFYNSYWIWEQGTSEELAQYRAANDYVVSRLLQYLDAHYLQCYPYYNVYADSHTNEIWRKHLDGVVGESRRLSPNAKRYILMSPQYHPSNATQRYRVVDDRQWDYMCSAAAATGERVVLWDFGYLPQRVANGVPGFTLNTPFNFSWYWWRRFRATKAQIDGSYTVTRAGEIEGYGDGLLLKKP
jgi:hypothetical protein